MADTVVVTDSATACVLDGSAVGMPQLCGDWYANQIFWLLLALAAIYFILVRVALPRLGGVLAERSGTVSNDLAAAEALKLDAAEAEKAYEKALADARGEAQRIADEARAEIKGELDQAIAKADARIAERTAESEAQIAEIRDGARASVADVARDVTGDIVRALGGTADDATVQAAVDARMKGN